MLSTYKHENLEHRSKATRRGIKLPLPRVVAKHQKDPAPTLDRANAWSRPAP